MGENEWMNLYEDLAKKVFDQALGLREGCTIKTTPERRGNVLRVSRVADIKLPDGKLISATLLAESAMRTNRADITVDPMADGGCTARYVIKDEELFSPDSFQFGGLSYDLGNGKCGTVDKNAPFLIERGKVTGDDYYGVPFEVGKLLEEVKGRKT